MWVLYYHCYVKSFTLIALWAPTCIQCIYACIRHENYTFSQFANVFSICIVPFRVLLWVKGGFLSLLSTIIHCLPPLTLYVCVFKGLFSLCSSTSTGNIHCSLSSARARANKYKTTMKIDIDHCCICPNSHYWCAFLSLQFLPRKRWRGLVFVCVDRAMILYYCRFV